MTTPLPGDFGCVAIRGPVGVFIRIGQWLTGSGFKNYEHAFVCISTDETGDALVVQAMPEGADTKTYHPASHVLWSTGKVPLTDEQRAKVVAAAESYIGVPYGFADYLAIAAHRWHLPIPGLRRWIASTRSMICSQLVAQAYQDAGVDLVPGQWDGYVTPAMLAGLISD